MFDISTIWLKTSYWTLSHVKELKKWWAIVFLAAAIFMIVFAITNIIIYVVNTPSENSLIAQIASKQVLYQEYREKNIPKDIEVKKTIVIPSLNNMYILVAKVENINLNWSAEQFEYQFIVDNEEVAKGMDSFMPNTDKFLIVSGFRYKGTGVPQVIQLTIGGTQWKKIKDIDKLPQADFLIGDIDHEFSTVNEVVSTVRVQAKVTNKTIYSFWRTKFVILLYSGERMVGVGSVYLDKFKTLEKRDLDITLTSLSDRITSIEIRPDIDLFDDDNFME